MFNSSNENRRLTEELATSRAFEVEKNTHYKKGFVIVENYRNALNTQHASVLKIVEVTVAQNNDLIHNVIYFFAKST